MIRAMCAARNSHLQIVILLLKHDNILLNMVNKYNETALILAAKYGNKDLVAELIKNDILISDHLDDKGKSAIMWAKEGHHWSIVELLGNN